MVTHARVKVKHYRLLNKVRGRNARSMGFCCDNCLDNIETTENFGDPESGLCGCSCCAKMCHSLCTLLFVGLLMFVGYYCYLYRHVITKSFIK
ncbi:ORF127 [Betabaculovirus altermyunipunctae]|uniref:ORF127 n=1 Tax=Betabaculovirus altermyunipunctae TaxID=3051996 RepID=A0A1S5YEA0_9BBAC|nr:ORF127 [Betabaculovirus altermyunipunctae]AQQ80394.1 ORF127 [Betabaculovirus altermyunipunctae]